MGAMRTAKWPGLPGKQADAFKAAKKGIKEVNGHPFYRGLSAKTPDEIQQETAGSVISENSLRSQGYTQEADNMRAQSQANIAASMKSPVSGAKNAVDASVSPMASTTPYNPMKRLR